MDLNAKWNMMARPKHRRGHDPIIRDLMVDSWITVRLRLSFELDQVQFCRLGTIYFWFTKEPKEEVMVILLLCIREGFFQTLVC